MAITYIGSQELQHILNNLKIVLDTKLVSSDLNDYLKQADADTKYVAVVPNKGLSTEDFSTELLNKLQGISANAKNVSVTSDIASSNGNKIATITIDGTPISIYAPKLTIDDTVTESSSNPVKSSGIATYVKNQLSSITGIKFATADSYEALPATGVAGTIYLVPNGGSSPNSKDEYIWVDATTKYEKIGTTDIDLDAYISENLKEIESTAVTTQFTSIFGNGYNFT